MPVRMILCPVKTKVHDITVTIELEEDGSAAVQLGLVLETVSESLRSFVLIVPRAVDTFQYLDGDLQVSADEATNDVRRVRIRPAKPVQPAERRELNLSFHWLDAAKLKRASHGAFRNLEVDIRSYGTPFSSSMISGLGELTGADRLGLRIVPPAGYELTAARPAWRLPKNMTVTRSSAEWVFRDVGTHNPARIRVVAMQAKASQDARYDVQHLEAELTKMQSAVRRLQQDLSFTQAENTRLRTILAQKEQELSALQVEFVLLKRNRFVYAIIALAIGLCLGLLLGFIF